MTTTQNRSWLLALVLTAITTGATYVAAQAKPAEAKPAQAQAACDCGACEQGDSHSGMQGKKMGMGMSMGAGGAGGANECPMMQDAAAMPGMTVEVENTKQGAILKLTAKTAADAPKIQQMAQKMAKHMESGCKMMHGDSGAAGGTGEQPAHKH